MSDDLDRLVADWARRSAPPPTPRAEMWDAIQAQRERSVPRNTWLSIGRITWFATGVAASLAILSFSRSMWDKSFQPQGSAGALEFSMVEELDPEVVEHLESVETLLSDYDAGPASTDTPTTAQELLSQTRLLIASGRLEGTEITDLFDDIELLLIQLVQLPANDDVERELFDDSLLSRSVLTRIRGLLAAAPTA